MSDKVKTAPVAGSPDAIMQWPQLLSDLRLGLEDYNDPRRGSRSDFQRDYDRLVFSSPFRRLQNKTQVFPLPGSIFVHNRLTHSMEVACVGRSLAMDVVAGLKARYADREWAGKLDAIPEIVAAACLAHDLGNPPFGHSGEKAISTYFSEGEGSRLRHLLTEEQWADLIHFEGNANSFRVLTHRFKGRRPGGFAMTYPTLASIVKYPFESTLAVKANKFGFFSSEREQFTRIANTLGLLRVAETEGREHRVRHPLVYLVEAADDICYEVMDIEDAHKLKILSTAEVIDHMLNFFDVARRSRIERVMADVVDPNEKIVYLRSCVVGVLVDRCVELFLDNEEAILRGQFQGSLLSNMHSREGDAYRRCNEMSWNKIYCASDVVDIELAGNQIVTFLLSKLISAVMSPELNYSRLLLSKFPKQYDVDAPDVYGKIQSVLDHVSAMTDVYALDLYRKLNGMSLPAV